MTTCRGRDGGVPVDWRVLLLSFVAGLPPCPPSPSLGVLCVCFKLSALSCLYWPLRSLVSWVMTTVQALRAEVESRRVLLANQELSLRERELALERREADSGAASATARLAAATAAAEAAVAEAAELRKHRQQEEADKERRAVEEAGQRQLAANRTPVERFWPPAAGDQDVEDATASSDAIETGTIAIQQAAPAQRSARREEAGSGKDARGQLPSHSFRCVCFVCVFLCVFVRSPKLKNIQLHIKNT